MSNVSTVHECSPQMSLSACLLHFTCDLLERRVSELFVVVLLPSAATKVFCWRDESRYTDWADTAIFQMGEGDVCSHTHTLQYTHFKAHMDMYISTHTHTHPQRREVVVKWQAKGTEWGGARGCVTKGQGHAVACVCQGKWCLDVCVCAGVLAGDTNTLKCGRQPPAACK